MGLGNTEPTATFQSEGKPKIQSKKKLKVMICTDFTIQEKEEKKNPKICTHLMHVWIHKDTCM